MPEQKPLPAFDLLVLGAVSILGDDATGKAIRREVEGVRKQTTVYLVIYDALRRLRERGFIQAIADGEGFLSYSLLDAGRYALAGEVPE